MASEQQNYKKKLMTTYSVVYFFVVLFFCAVLFQVVKLSTYGGAKYRDLGKHSLNDSIKIEANRGNIYDCNGKLLASTIPSYRLHMDMRMDGLTKDTFYKYVDSMSICLSRLYGTASPREFKQRLTSAYHNGSRYFLVDNKRLSYTEYKQVLSFPYFRKNKKSGACWESFIRRERPFGMLAQRTIGNINMEGNGTSGLEMAFNEDLKGVPGVGIKEKKGGEWLKVNIVDPIDGKEIVSTIDIDIQDIAEEALLRTANERKPEWACAVVMEVETGEIKAIANLSRSADSTSYTEGENFAVKAMTEPGSTFKTASVMVALEDGLTDTSEVFDTGHGYWAKEEWYTDSSKTNRPHIRDHNVKYNKDGSYSDEGGYGKITLAEAMWFSSNIGIAKMVDKYYGGSEKQKRFLNRLYDMRLKDSLELHIPGTAAPKFRDPRTADKDNKWDATTLLWMSYGYNMQVPPIYTLTFYNGIANGGKMVSPWLVKSINQNGSPIKTFDTKTLKRKLCSESTLRKVRSMLEGVVTDGTGKVFKSNNVSFAGKTGTTQLNYGSNSTKKKGLQHSFCGYFPADNPQYSCIVVVYRPIYGGISPAGLTFREIAEHVSARKVSIVSNDQKNRDVKLPPSFKGNRHDLETVFKHLDVPYYRAKEDKNKEWANPSATEGGKHVKLAAYDISYRSVPNVVGMGAKDAVYMIERCGMKARVHGYGDVKEQSVSPGAPIIPGGVVDLKMRH